ncbi:gamma-glutamyltransferase family protein [Mycolicibacterium palauense]|uniref:gamma-glutamyltransferase family protein n=1 Tax=Mycolicibacterium palauense TaxID=2034511 RepID=UPI000BFF1557|nr:gamma-glutamyltransferase [Mycolicibacterium palauense]
MNPGHRPPALSATAMVSSSHPAASLAGARVLADGGNALDATLAMAAVTWLTLPGQCGIGGDAFAVVREPDGRVWTVNGSGYGPDGGTPEFYAEHGLAAIPLDGARAVAVPGAPAALAALHAGGASRSLHDLWEPAARLAENGLPCSARTAGDVTEALSAVRADPGLAAAYTGTGGPPHVGSVLAQPDLAATIRALALDPAGFYTGTFAERAVAALRAGGAPFSGDEWAATAAVTAEPAITGRYAGAVVHQTPLPTPGWMVLHQAALCDGVVGFHGWLSADGVDRMARAARLAFADRLALCGSDNSGSRDVLHPRRIEAQRRDLAERRGRSAPIDVRAGDTTSTVAVDAQGRAVSFIHSLAFTFGAKFTVPGTGVALNNRLGRGAYLTPGHPNAVAPRRKPLHTLNAWIVTDDAGQLLHVGNTPGGDGQVQWNMQLLSHLLDHGLDPAEAVAAPRFTVFPGSDADVVGAPDELRVEAGLAAPVRAALSEAGHRVVVKPALGEGGSAQVISRDDRGILSGAADPRQEGVALGVD